MSQKDLAAKINEKPSILQDYEAGKAIPNPQILGKLERQLGVKLRGNSYSKVTPVYMLIATYRVRHWEEAGGAKEDYMIS